MIIAFGVAWRVNSTAATLVSASQSYPDPAALDSLGPYLRPLALTSTRTGAPNELIASEEYFGPPRDYSPDFGVAPSAPRPAPRAQWTVSAILMTDLRRMAVVNDSVVVVGSTMPGGARVVAIESSHVVLQESGGRRRTISLNR